MNHLGDLAAALVDNELSHDQRDHALAHLAHCTGCRAEVDAQRRLKAMLANQPDCAPSIEFQVQLFAIAVPRPDVVRGAVRGPVRPKRRQVRARPLRRARVAGGLSAFALTLAGAIALGDGESAPRVRPPVANFVDDHISTTGQLGSLNDPTGSAVLVSFGR